MNSKILFSVVAGLSLAVFFTSFSVRSASAASETGAVNAANNATIHAADETNACPEVDDVYASIFGSVDQAHLLVLLKEISGSSEVTVGGEKYTINERYSPAGKASFRKYWKQYYETLGMAVTEQAYPTQHHETSGEEQGHNLEAILPGQVADTIVIIVHYDSIGPDGAETANPGVDDDMTGMAIQLETARVLAAYRGRLHYTVRFVAADYEEWSALEGARRYARGLRDQAAVQGFKIIAAIDDEQSGWNCAGEGLCLDNSTTPKMLINDCSSDGKFASKELSGAMIALSEKYDGTPIVTECAGQDSDHWAFWEIGVPAIEFGEYSWQKNDHFDASGGDTYDKIDEGYFYGIARVGLTFAAKTIGITGKAL